MSQYRKFAWNTQVSDFNEENLPAFKEFTVPDGETLIFKELRMVGTNLSDSSNSTVFNGISLYLFDEFVELSYDANFIGTVIEQRDKYSKSIGELGIPSNHDSAMKTVNETATDSEGKYFTDFPQDRTVYGGDKIAMVEDGSDPDASGNLTFEAVFHKL